MSEEKQEKTYQEEYDEAIAAMDAAEEPAVKPAPEATTSETVGAVLADKPAVTDATDVQPKEPAPEPDQIETLRKQIESQQKALQDTQRWAHELNAKLKKQDDEDRRKQHEASKPELLRANPELEDAIRHVTAPREPAQETPQAPTFHQILERAHPDLRQLQAGDPEFWAAAVKRFDEVPEANADPVVAIRVFTEVKSDFAQRRAQAAAAAKQAQQTVEKRAMSVPGAGGSVAKPAAADPEEERARKMWNMSDEEFDKETNRVMGLSR